MRKVLCPIDIEEKTLTFIHSFTYVFINYILLIMLLQWSQFFPLCACPSNNPHYSGNPHSIVHIHGPCVYILWLLHFLYYTLHPHGYSVTNNLYFLIPSPLHPFPHTPSHLAAIKMLFVSMILSPFFLFA